MWYKLKRATMRVNGTEKQIRPTWRIPSAYQEVEWIWNSWTEFIDTGFYPDSNTTVQMKFIYSQYAGWTIFWYGLSEADMFRFFRADNTTYLDYGSGQRGNRISWTYITSTTDIYECEFWNRYVKDIPTDTVKFSSSVVSFARKSYTARIFGDINDIINLYYCKVYDNWTLVRDFVPCYRKSDWEIWVYDIVNSQFYTNSWTGTFTKWADV